MRSAFFFALVLTLSATAARAEIKVGDVFPALATAGLTGGTVPATEGKILVVDFWASWCAPCKASFPALGKINTDYTPRGVVLVGDTHAEGGEDNSRSRSLERRVTQSSRRALWRRVCDVCGCSLRIGYFPNYVISVASEQRRDKRKSL